MTDDERALLAAVVADPADDTVRLAYADCVEERGNAARAVFIRLQIEAERLHPDSNARTAVERRAEALLAEHWIDWWGEVCAGVEFPSPSPKPNTRLGRFAHRVGLSTPPGEPYIRSGFHVRPRSGLPIDGWSSVAFRRGFPDTATFSIPIENFSLVRSTLELWPAATPLADLTAKGLLFLVAGPHLAGVRSLSLFDCELGGLHSVLGSPHFARLRELDLPLAHYGGAERFANELAQVVASPRVRQLERLSLRVGTHHIAETIANARNLTGLQALHVDLSPEGDDDPTATQRLATLARSPHLAGLRELSVGPVIDPDAVRALTHGPTWKGLRKLILPNWRFLTHEAWVALFSESTLPALEDLVVGLVDLERDMDLLVRSPLLKQLRHLTLGALGSERLSDADQSRLAEIVDPERIETFALSPDSREPRVDELRRRFGDRFRMTGS